jgi:lipoteichoic acid synthase
LISGSVILLTHNRLMDEGNSQQMSWASAIREQPCGALYTDFTDVNRSMGVTGLYQYTVRNFFVSTGLDQWLQTSNIRRDLDAKFLERQKTVLRDNAMTGKLAGKNVIMIMLESIDTWMLTEEYMPNLYSLQQKSIQFVNHYSHQFINAATLNSEFMALTGLIPPTSGIKQSVYKTNDFSYSLPSLFREKGYRAESFHSAEPIIYDRGAIHRNIGFSAYYCWYQMGMSDYQMDSQLINAYDRMTATAPFFDFIITYSGHGPYTEELGNISAPHFERAVSAAKTKGITASDENLRQYYHAIAHAMETDAFIGSLMDRLEADGRIEDTVLVVFSDHYSKYMSDISFVMELKGEHNPDLLSKTPFFIYARDIPPQKVSKYTSTIDIFPTLVNLFGLDADPAYFVGRDAFGEEEGYAMFRNYAWYDGETYFSADYEGDVTEEMTARTEEVRERVNLSWDTLTSDYFAYLREKHAR